jgi:MoaA/NifB/PqqE/SkfB family radical SAM enzyme
VASSPARGSSPTGTFSRAEIVDLAAHGTPVPLPVEAYVEVANRRNSLCATCPLTFSPQEAARQLSLVEFKALVAQLPDLRRAVRRISLDSSTPETYVKIRGIPVLERVVASLGEVVRTRQRMASRTPRISMWMAGLRENLAELPDIIGLAARLDGEEVYLQQHFVFSGEGLATADQSIFNLPVLASGSSAGADAEATIAEAERRAMRQGVGFHGAARRARAPASSSAIPRSTASRGGRAVVRRGWCTSRPRAAQLPCCIAPFTDAPFDSLWLGNYLADGVTAILHGSDLQPFRDQIYSSEPPTPCRNCGLAWSF